LKKVRPYLTLIIIGFLITVFYLWVADFFNAEFIDKLRLLCDGFTFPAVFYFSIAVLSWVASDGFFDALSYSGYIFKKFFLPFLDHEDKMIHYYDYQKERKEKRKEKTTNLSPLFLSALFFGLIALIFLMLFNHYYH